MVNGRLKPASDQANLYSNVVRGCSSKLTPSCSDKCVQTTPSCKSGPKMFNYDNCNVLSGGHCVQPSMPPCYSPCTPCTPCGPIPAECPGPVSSACSASQYPACDSKFHPDETHKKTLPAADGAAPLPVVQRKAYKGACGGGVAEADQ